MSCGSLVASNIIFLKCFGEILKAGEYQEMKGLVIACLTLGILGGLMFIFTLNVAMRYYDNIDVIPVFQSFILLMTLSSGWIVFNEVQFYTPIQIAGIVCTSLVVCAGIKTITLKRASTQTNKQAQLEDQLIEANYKTSKTRNGQRSD